MATTLTNEHFCQTYGWGSNWPVDHDSVTKIQETYEFTMLFMLSLVQILQGHKMSWSKIWLFFCSRVAPYVPKKPTSELQFKKLFERTFKEKDHRGNLKDKKNLSKEFLEAPFFPEGTWEDQDLAAVDPPLDERPPAL